MKLFIDSADLCVLRDLAATGFVEGVTTNPSLVAKQGGAFIDVMAEICALVPGPVSAEVIAAHAEGMVSEGKALSAIAANLVVKLPLTWAGLAAARALGDVGIKTNVTLCFSPTQALMAAKAGATFVSPFVGRLDDHGASGAALIADIRAIYDIHRMNTQILAASIRTNDHVFAVARAGADCATLPPSVFKDLLAHPLTDRGLEQFTADWRASGQTILA